MTRKSSRASAPDLSSLVADAEPCCATRIREEAKLLRTILITVIFAGTISGLQTWLKLTSREKFIPSGASVPEPRLKREDAVFWTEWFVTAVIGFALSGWRAYKSGNYPPIEQWAASLFLLLVGLSVIPFVIKERAYDATNVMRWPWVVMANLFGLVALAGAVAVGVKVYEW